MRSAVSLDKIANDVCIALGDTHFNHKLTVVNHLLDCYRDFSLYIGAEVSVKTVCLKYGNVINLPNDFVYETKVGVRVNDNIAILSLDNSNLENRVNDTECRSYFTQIWDGEDDGATVSFYNVQGGKGELYGRGRGVNNPGTFSINRRDGVIEIGSHIPLGAEIIVEYITDNVSDVGLKMIPTEAKKMHEYFALSEMQMSSKYSNITKAQINRNRYETEFGRVKRLYNYRDPKIIVDAINACFSPTNY